MHTTSRFITSIVMPLSTSMLPAKVLCTSLIETSGWSGVHDHHFTAKRFSSASVARAIG